MRSRGRKPSCTACCETENAPEITAWLAITGSASLWEARLNGRDHGQASALLPWRGRIRHDCAGLLIRLARSTLPSSALHNDDTATLLEARLPKDQQSWASQYHDSLKHLDSGLKVLDDGVFGGSIKLKDDSPSQDDQLHFVKN